MQNLWQTLCVKKYVPCGAITDINLCISMDDGHVLTFFTLTTIGLSQSYCKTGSLWSWRRGALKNVTTQFSSDIALGSPCEYVVTTFWLTTHVSLDCVAFPGRRVCSSTRPLQVPVFCHNSRSSILTSSITLDSGHPLAEGDVIRTIWAKLPKSDLKKMTSV